MPGMSSARGGPEASEALWDRQVWLDQHCLKTVQSDEEEIAWVCRCGNDFGDGSVLHDEDVAKQHELSEGHRT